MEEKMKLDSTFTTINTIRKLIKYNDIGFVLNDMDSTVSLHVPIKKQKMSEELYRRNKDIAFKTIYSSQHTLDTFIKEANFRQETFDEIREHDSNFCKDMQTKLPQDEYDKYISSIKKCLIDLSNIIFAFRTLEGEDYSELLLNAKDPISKVIDSSINCELSFIEDKFVLEEIKNLDISKMNKTLQNRISTIKHTLIERIDKYNFYKNLRETKNKEIHIVNKEQER